MRDRVAWAGGGSLNCGSDWDEDLDIFSRPCNPCGGMTGSCFQAPLYRSRSGVLGRGHVFAISRRRAVGEGVYEQASEGKDEGQLCTMR